MRGLLKLQRGLCALGVPKELPQGDLWGEPEMNCIPMPAASFLQLAGLWKGAKFGEVSLRAAQTPGLLQLWGGGPECAGV